MIKILAPTNYEKEKIYVFDTLFDNFLGIKYQIEFIESLKDFQIEFEDKIIIIKDDFWSRVKGSYLHKKYLPKKIKSMKIKLNRVHNLIVLYGDDVFEKSSRKIFCGLDIISCAYFMLSRWEEYVVKERDLHNRYEGGKSVAFKNNYLNRPIVNEYVEALWDMLESLGYKTDRKERKYSLYLSHDVDHITRWYNPVQLVKRSYLEAKDNNLISAIKQPLEFIASRAGFIKDPFDTYDHIMDLSERVNKKSIFFVHVGGNSVFDSGFRWNKRLLENYCHKVTGRGHEIGLHASYNAYNDQSLFSKEYKFLKQSCGGREIIWSRNHFLRFDVPRSYRVITSIGIKMDSTLGYHDEIGYRCGTCYSYKPFDFIRRKACGFYEYPLIVMDGTLLRYNEYSISGIHKKIINLINNTKKYNGNFVLLWHNSSFNTTVWKKYGDLYTDILLKAK